MAFIEGWPHLRGGLYEGFHCINFLMHKASPGAVGQVSLYVLLSPEVVFLSYSQE